MYKVSKSHSIKVSKYVKVLKNHSMKVWKYHSMILWKYQSGNLSDKGLIWHEDVDQASQGGVPWVVDDYLVHVFSESWRFLQRFFVSHFRFNLTLFQADNCLIAVWILLGRTKQTFFRFFLTLTVLQKRFMLLTSI